MDNECTITSSRELRSLSCPGISIH